MSNTRGVCSKSYSMLSVNAPLATRAMLRDTYESESKRAIKVKSASMHLCRLRQMLLKIHYHDGLKPLE